MDLSEYLRFFAALVFVLALIGTLSWLARRYGFGTAAGRPRNGKAGKRIGVVEAAAIDGKRRLVLIRRDGVEHLVLLGLSGETVIETGISPPAAPSKPVFRPAKEDEAA